MKGIVWIGKDGIYVDGQRLDVAIPKIPHPDLEASRIYWDEETQSVKQKIIPLSDMKKEEL